jgi:hypothetical protein
MMLTERVFDSHIRPLIDLAVRPNSDGSPRLDLNASYQRGHVWTHEQRRNLIKSLLEGLPIGAVFLNERSIMEPIVVIDGKQRLETIRMFVNNEFSIPANWVDTMGVTGELVTWDDLTQLQRRRCDNHWTVATYTSKLKTEAEERELFNRVNFGGTPHNETERA